MDTHAMKVYGLVHPTVWQIYEKCLWTNIIQWRIVWIYPLSLQVRIDNICKIWHITADVLARHLTSVGTEVSRCNEENALLE